MGNEGETVMSSRTYCKVGARVAADGCGKRGLLNCRLLLVAFVVLACLCPAFVAFAAAQPTFTAMETVDVYRNLAEEGDALFVFHWEYDYSDNVTMLPDEPASDSIIYRFFDTDGTTLLATGTPYVFSPLDTNGYEDNVGAFYFNAADNLTWGQAYTISVYGTPGFFTPAVEIAYVLQAEDYTTSTTQAENRAEVYALVLSLADRFSSLYDIELKTTSDSGIVLASYGELFFRGAIDGLQTLCPALFFIQVYVPEAMAVQPYDMSLGTTYTGRTSETDLGRGFTRLGQLMGGMSKAFAAGVVWMAILMTIIIVCLKKKWGMDTGMLLCVPAGIAGAVIIGDVIFTVLMCLSLVAGIGIIYLVSLKRAG